MKQKQIKNELFARSMSRKDFLKFSALALFMLFGLNNLIGFLGVRGVHQQQSQVSHKSGHGFGSSKFGV